MFPKRSFPLAMAAYCLALAAVQTLVTPPLTWGDVADRGEDDEVHDLMETVHEGKNSPWRKVNRAVKADSIDWKEIESAIPRFEKMSAALAKAKDAAVRDAAGGYIDSVKDLAAQSKKRDVPGARKALKSLSQSCADCHYKGGPGGKLED